ncbi:MAG TPA: MOSC N-terminal beta barrel domain-containing protein [Gaiellaceae bacterium]|nr:MOSC N-terminal beta barrel domain-containing protein [Gaiellaceae bacterium]
MTARVAWISLTPVKATRLHVVDEVELTEAGVRGDRRFYLVDGNGRRVNCKDQGVLQLVRADYDEAADVLVLRFPGGRVAEAPVERGGEIETTFGSQGPRLARELVGPWSEALSAYAGRPLRVVEPALPAQDRGRSGAASLLSTGSLARIAGQLGVAAVDERRFRMNFVLDGLEPHAEDGWLGRRVRLGEAVVIPQGNVGRCAITTQDPDRGVADLDTLKALAAYRGDVETTEPLPFGVHAAVAEPGRVRVGDPVEVL